MKCTSLLHDLYVYFNEQYIVDMLYIALLFYFLSLMIYTLYELVMYKFIFVYMNGVTTTITLLCVHIFPVCVCCYKSAISRETPIFVYGQQRCRADCTTKVQNRLHNCAV